MIVPQNRLLFWLAAVGLPFSVLGPLLPEARLPAFLLGLTLLTLIVLDAILALNRLDGIQVNLPETVRLSKGRPGSMELVLRNEQQKGDNLRLGVPLPDHLHGDFEDQFVQLPNPGEQHRLFWPLRASRRGRFTLSQTRLERTSPLGFWAVRATLHCPAEIRVYPNLLTERRQLAGLFLNRGTFGLHARRQVGKGREFEKLRDYIPGDGYEDIHWKATAKRRHPVTKVFQIERTQEVYVIVDASRLSARPVLPAGEPALDRYLTAALVLGLAAEKQGDLFGLATFSDRVDTFIRARNGRTHYNACRDAIYMLHSQPVTPDYEEVATFIQLRLRRRALLLFLTALDDPVLAESFIKSLDLIARKHLVMVHMINPPGAHPLFSHPDVKRREDLYDRLGGHLQWHKLRELEKVLQRRGVHLSLPDHENLCPQLVTQYLEVKRRQLL